MPQTNSTALKKPHRTNQQKYPQKTQTQPQTLKKRRKNNPANICISWARDTQML